MKAKIKQGSKSMVALFMVVLMAFMPLNGSTWKVYGSEIPSASTEETGVVRIAFDAYVNSAISVAPESEPGSSNNGTGDIIAEGKQTNSYTLKSDTSYTLTANLIDDLKDYKDNIQITDEKGIVKNGAFMVTSNMITNDVEDIDISLVTSVKNEIFLDVSIQDTNQEKNISITNVMVNNAIVTKEKNGKYQIAAGTPLTTEITISFTTGINKKVVATNVTCDGVSDAKRNYTYTTTVGELLKSKGKVSLTSGDATVYGVTSSNATVTIPASYKVSGADQYYEPIGNDTFNIEVTSADGYKITKVTIGGSIMSGVSDSAPLSKVTIPISSIQNGAIDITTIIDAPNGAFSIKDYYGPQDAIITYTKPKNLKEAYTLQYAISENGSATMTDLTKWENATWVEQESLYTLTVPYTAGVETKYVYVRYINKTSVSLFAGPGEVRFDENPPTIGNIKFFINGKEYDIINDKDEIANLIVNAKTEFRVYASDDKSGLSTLVLNSDKEINPDPSGSYFAISYDVLNPVKSMEFIVKDKAENASVSQEIKPQELSFDLTLPKAEYEFRRGESVVDIANWQPGAVTVILTPSDPPASVNEGETVSGVETVHITENGAEIGSIDPTTKVYTGTVNGDGEHVLNITVIDKAGNSFEETKTVKIDSTGVTNMQILLENGRDKYYQDFTITAGADSKAGIQSIQFDFIEQGEIVASHTVSSVVNNSAKFVYSQAMGNFNGAVRVTFTDVLGRVSRSEKEFAFSKDGAAISLAADSQWTNKSASVIATVSDPITNIEKIEFYVDGNLVATERPQTPISYVGGISISEPSASYLGTQVEVVVTSESGKVTRAYAIVRVDKQAPSIQLSGITEGAVYNSIRALQITTVENIWQEMRQVTVTATKQLDGTTTNVDLGSYSVTDGTFTTSRSFSEDGLYQVVIQAVDAAGNSDTKTITFTIDRTAPLLSMTGASDGTYSNTPVVVNFQAIESFFETNTVRIHVERKLEGTTYERSIAFVNTGKTSTLRTAFAEDGDYVITFTATDGAGNIAATQTLSFTVDRTAPSITLTGTVDYFVTNKAVTLNFSVIESYFSTNNVQIQGNRRVASGKTLPVAITGWSNTGRISSLRQEFTEDGYYTITITATDKAGNRKEQTIHFTIDTEPPVIGDLSQYDGKYLKEFQLMEKLEDLIIELSVPIVRMTLNGEPYDGSKITKDGKYTLVIEVEDEVGLTASKTIEFVVDTIAPKVIFAGAENNRIYTEAINLNLSLENENDRILEILINGEPYEIIDGVSFYNLSFHEPGKYVIVVNTIDEAGNTNSQTITVSYIEERSILLLIVLLGALAAAGLVIFLMIKARKDQPK